MKHACTSRIIGLVCLVLIAACSGQPATKSTISNEMSNSSSSLSAESQSSSIGVNGIFEGEIERELQGRLNSKVDLQVHIDKISDAFLRGTFYEPWSKKMTVFVATERDSKNGSWGAIFYEYQGVPINCSVTIGDYGFPEDMVKDVCGNLE